MRGTLRRKQLTAAISVRVPARFGHSSIIVPLWSTHKITASVNKTPGEQFLVPSQHGGCAWGDLRALVNVQLPIRVSYGNWVTTLCTCSPNPICLNLIKAQEILPQWVLLKVIQQQQSVLIWLWQQYLIYFGIKNKPLNIEEHWEDWFTTNYLTSH